LRKIADSLITKSGTHTESYYDYLISRYIAPFFTLFFKNIGIKNPNIVTFCSFVFIVLPSLMVLWVSLLDSVLYRIFIACIIQISFALDCSDGQLARITGTTSKLGAWIDRVLDRVGEFLIFVCFGFTAWHQYGNILFLYLGILTGYGLSIFTMAMSLSDSVQFDNLKIIKALEKNKKDNKKESSEQNRNKKNKREAFYSVISKVFFFLNFGIGERYLYLSFFILINRVDIMLYISAFLTTLRFLSISHHVGKKLKKYDRLTRESNE